MRRIGIQARMPEQGDRDLRDGERKRKAVHPGAQVAGVALGHGRDQVGAARERQRFREAADDGDDLPFQPERLQRVIDQPLVEPR